MPAGYVHIMVSDEALEGIKQRKLIVPQLLGNLFENFHLTQLGSLGQDDGWDVPREDREGLETRELFIRNFLEKSPSPWNSIGNEEGDNWKEHSNANPNWHHLNVILPLLKTL